MLNHVSLIFITLMVAAPLHAASYYTIRLNDPKAVYLTKDNFAVHADGVGDDAAALQQAINKVQETTRKGIVFIPEGQYRLGKTVHVENERQVDMAAALSGTGPTYIFLVMEALIDAGVHMGFSRHVAEQLVHQTMLGSVLFARESHKHPAELRNMVTSPGGTSAEAIYQMEKGSLRTVLSKAVWAAYQRAESLGQK